MDISKKVRTTKTLKPTYIEEWEAMYPHNVNMYRIPPTDDITLSEFEEMALERLGVLRIFEDASNRGFRLMSKEWKDHILADLNRSGYKTYVRLLHGSAGKNMEADLRARRRDHISHFILRLCYCRTADLRRTFITHEMELFKFKFDALTPTEVKEFLEFNDLKFTPLTDEQKNEVKDGLYESTAGHSVAKIEMLDFYKVPFTDVTDLVRSRRCYVKNFFAYVNVTDIVSIIASKQLYVIEKGLEATLRIIPHIDTDDRIRSMVKNLSTSYTGKDYTLSKNESVPIESLDQLSRKSFPPCMRHYHDVLRAKHHHKHVARLQYGLFLKGIGVTLEDSLRFWREEFTKLMDVESFEKNYSYNIRHIYGKVGSMKNMSPYSCLNIIMQSSGLDVHGCPFKMLDSSSLKARLTGYGLSANHCQEIVNITSKGHYQIACGRYFEVTHDTKLEEGINHPNHYFELSQTVMGNRAPKSSAGGGAKQPVGKFVKKKMNGPDLVVLKQKELLMDPSNDDELWNLTQVEEVKESQKKAAAEIDEDFDYSQLDEY